MRLKLLLYTVLLLLFSCDAKKPTDDQNFQYLGQQLPDSIPVIFGEGVISVKGRFDMGLAISPDNNSIAFGVAHESNPEETCIYLMNYTKGEWTSPSRSFLPNNENTFFPMFSPSGDELYFAKSVDESPTDLWVAKYIDDKAINPQPLDSMFNSNSREAGHGKSKSGSFYFTSNRDESNPCCGDIYFTQLESEGHSQIKKSEILSSEADEESLFLSPNEDFIIIQVWKTEFGSKHDLYISYRTKNDSWTTPKRLNQLINSKEIEQRPFVSPDNKFLFFSRTGVTQENGQDVYDSDIYWVSTKSAFQPYVYNPEVEASIKFNEEFELKLPKDIFKDVDDQNLTYQLTLEDGSEIPGWIGFDDDRLTLSGKWETKETLSFKLIATDTSGNSKEFSFDLKEKSN